MDAVIIIGKNLSPTLAKARANGAYVFGADQGAKYCLDHQIRLDSFVGDFDSVNEEEKHRILTCGAVIEELNPHKDVTDTAHALSLCKWFNRVTILGGVMGDRIEHFLANVDLLRSRPNTCFMEDDDSFIVVLDHTRMNVSRDEWEYVSVFALTEAKVTLLGMEYPLEHRDLTPGDPIGVSNQIKEDSGAILSESGLLLVVLHRKKTVSQ